MARSGGLLLSSLASGLLDVALECEALSSLPRSRLYRASIASKVKW
jgi:hypothetical protein